jgi:hypothetical protein
MKAIVNFRTKPNGAFKWMRGLVRGYWRVLIVEDEHGSTDRNSHNVYSVLWEGRDGLCGVTSASKYDIHGDLLHALELADRWNVVLMAQQMKARRLRRKRSELESDLNLTHVERLLAQADKLRSKHEHTHRSRATR